MGKGKARRRRAANELKHAKGHGAAPLAPAPKPMKAGQDSYMPRSLQRLKQAQQRTLQVLSERPAKRRKVAQGNHLMPESAGPTRAQEEPAEELLPQQEAPPAQEQTQQPENAHVPSKKHKPANARKRPAAGDEPPKASSKSFIKQRKLRRKDRQLEARALERDGELPQEAVPFGEQALQPIKVNLKRKHWDARGPQQRMQQLFKKQLAEAGHRATQRTHVPSLRQQHQERLQAKERDHTRSEVIQQYRQKRRHPGHKADMQSLQALVRHGQAQAAQHATES